MKILYILPFVPWPVRVRSSNLIPRLARRHEIHLLCLAQSQQEEERLNGIGQQCRSAGVVFHSRFRALLQAATALPQRTPLRIAYCRSNEMRAAVVERIADLHPDVIYVERWRALQYVPEGTNIPVVSDPTDSMTLYNRRLLGRGAWWERVIGLEEYLKFLRYEPRLARRATVTVFCSEHDLECVQQNAAVARFAIIPNGVDCQQFFRRRPEEEEENRVVFAGNLGYRPNRHAVEFFLQQIFPTILSRVPDCRFTVVGNQSTDALARYAKMRGVELVDYVPGLRPYLARATVAVAPLTVGAGVSNKLLEAFATGTPVVATPLACGDLPLTHREHLLIAEEPQMFAEQVMELLRTPALRTHLAQAGWQLVRDQYDWEIVSAQMEALLLDAGKGARRYKGTEQFSDTQARPLCQ